MKDSFINSYLTAVSATEDAFNELENCLKKYESELTRQTPLERSVRNFDNLTKIAEDLQSIENCSTTMYEIMLLYTEKFNKLSDSGLEEFFDKICDNKDAGANKTMAVIAKYSQTLSTFEDRFSFLRNKEKRILEDAIDKFPQQKTIVPTHYNPLSEPQKKVTPKHREIDLYI